MPRRRGEPVFYDVSMGSIRTRAQLGRFVRRKKESRRLEFKRLCDLRACGRCNVCQDGGAPDHQRRKLRGEPVAEAICALANGPGGVLVIGAIETNRATGQHALETRACTGLAYCPEWISQTVSSRISPPLNVEPRLVESQDGLPPTFIVEVPAAPDLHQWVEDGARHFPIRREATSIDMDASDIQFLVRTKQSVVQNAELRNELAFICYSLFNGLMERPNENPRRNVTLDRILREDPFQVSTMDASLTRRLNDRRIDRAILETPSKMVMLSTPRDIFHAIENLDYYERHLAYGSLDHRELRLFAAGRILKPRGRSGVHDLSPADLLSTSGGKVWEKLHGEFYSSKYDESFERVYDRVAPQFGKIFDAETKIRSIYDLSDALSLFLPVAYQVIRFYAELAEEYGTQAIGVYGPQLAGSLRRRGRTRLRECPIREGE